MTSRILTDQEKKKMKHLLLMKKKEEKESAKKESAKIGLYKPRKRVANVILPDLE